MPDKFGNSDADLERGDNEVMRSKEDGFERAYQTWRDGRFVGGKSLREWDDISEKPNWGELITQDDLKLLLAAIH